MEIEIHVGDCVKLLGLPAWLLHDLPKDEQQEMQSYIGQVAVVEKIDEHGYFWLGFGSTAEIDDATSYSGHSFCITREFIELSSAIKQNK